MSKWSLGLFGLLFAGLSVAAGAQPASATDEARPRRVVRPEVGQPVPDFALTNVKGATVQLSQFRGKSIFVLELGACT